MNTYVVYYWPCTHYRKGPIAENSYLFQYRAFLLFFVYIRGVFVKFLDSSVIFIFAY